MTTSAMRQGFQVMWNIRATQYLIEPNILPSLDLTFCL